MDCRVKNQETRIMPDNTDQPKAPATKPGPQPDPTPIQKDGTIPKAKAKPDPTDDLKTLPIAQVQDKLKSSPAGLTQDEAAKRLTQYGPNEIKEKKRTLSSNSSAIYGDPFHG